MKTVYQDLVYFGYDMGQEGIESQKTEKEFMKEIKESFPDVEFKNAYDSIKGYRQEIFLPEGESDNYFSWLLGKQWYNLSLTMQLIMMSASTDTEKEAEFKKYLALAKKQYPEAFKPESLEND